MSEKDLGGEFKVVLPVPPELLEISAVAELTEKAFAMSLDEFRTLKAADRETILFALIREQCSSTRAIEEKIAEYEDKARQLMSPEGIEEIKNKVMGSLGGGMFKGFF